MYKKTASKELCVERIRSSVVLTLPQDLSGEPVPVNRSQITL